MFARCAARTQVLVFVERDDAPLHTVHCALTHTSPVVSAAVTVGAGVCVCEMLFELSLVLWQRVCK